MGHGLLVVGKQESMFFETETTFIFSLEQAHPNNKIICTPQKKANNNKKTQQKTLADLNFKTKMLIHKQKSIANSKLKCFD